MINQKYLKECFDYDPDSGNLVWKHRPRKHFPTDRGWKITNGRCAGKIAGHAEQDLSRKRQTKYLQVIINGKSYRAHRLIWLLVYGCLPKNHIDHIDGDGLNNSLANLRDVPHLENSKNMPMTSRNKSGIVGVYWCKRSKVWRAKIKVRGVTHYLGGFDCIDKARAARKRAEKKYGFHANHGRQK